MSLRWRVALSVGVIVALALAAGGFAAYASTRAELRGEIDDFLRDRTETFQRAAAEGRLDRRGAPRRPDPRAFFGGLPITEADSITQIVDVDAGVIFSLQGADALPVDPDTIERVRRTRETVFEDIDLDSGPHRMATAPFDSGTVAQVARSLAETNDALAGVRNRLIAVGLVTTVAAALLGWAVARRTARPIEQLADSAEHVAVTQQLDTPISSDGAGEVARLAASLTSMLSALDASRRQQQQLVMDAGHELRTPLTTLRTNVELLERDDLSPEDEARVRSTISAELGELTHLVAELVDLGTDTRRVEPAEPCDVAEVAATVAHRAERRHEREVEVVGDATVIMGQPALLERALSNLVDNAAKFSPPGSPMEIVVGPGQVGVCDHGPGIDPADLPHLFDRFYRATAARSLPGSGLGLAIVKQVAELHGGQPFARNADDGNGAVVGFTFSSASVSEPEGEQNTMSRTERASASQKANKTR